MSKMMTLEVLSSIKGAKESDAVNALFDAIKNAQLPDNNNQKQASTNFVSIDDLREDKIVKNSEKERELIIKNFPKQKNDYLVVLKVVED